MSNTTNQRTVFVMGKDITRNKSVVVLESGEEYDIDPAAIVSYTSVAAQFPYTL